MYAWCLSYFVKCSKITHWKKCPVIQKNTKGSTFPLFFVADVLHTAVAHSWTKQNWPYLIYKQFNPPLLLQIVVMVPRNWLKNAREINMHMLRHHRTNQLHGGQHVDTKELLPIASNNYTIYTVNMHCTSNWRKNPFPSRKHI